MPKGGIMKVLTFVALLAGLTTPAFGIEMTVDPGGFDITTGTERDPLGRVTKEFRPPFFDFHDGRFFSTFEYNELGQVVKSTGSAPFSISTRTCGR